jgi:hypothetical protein
MNATTNSHLLGDLDTFLAAAAPRGGLAVLQHRGVAVVLVRAALLHHLPAGAAYPIVTSQCRSTIPYQVFDHIQSLLS